MLGIYCRTSRKESICGVETIDQQKQAGIQFAENNHLNYTIYEDSGKSGYIETSKEDPFISRPAFKKLLADIDSGKINQVWIWEISRLSRRNKHFADIIEKLQKKQIILNVLNSPFDLSNEYIVSMVLMQGVWAQAERNEIIARTSRGKAAATDRGHLRHGSLYGYRTDKNKITTPDFEELETVKAIFADYLNGLNLREIGLKYFTDGHPETEKLLSKVKKVKQILAHEEYTGQNLKIAGRKIEKDFEEEKLSELSELSKDDYWVNNHFYKEKIIDRETWIKAREKLEWIRRSISAVKKNTTRETNRSVASGFLRCATCGCNYYYRNLRDKGGLVYKHLGTVEKCSQKPIQISFKRLDTIIDVFYTFYYLLFDNTEDRLRQMKLSVKQNSKVLNKQLKELEKQRDVLHGFIEVVNKNVSAGVFNDDADAFIETMKTLADYRRKVDSLNNEIKLKNLEIEENKTKDSEFTRNEKYQLGTIERLQKWFDLREKESFAELRQMLNEVLFDGFITIDGTSLEFISGDPGRTFYFDLNHDYKIIYPFIEKVIDRKFDLNFSTLEKSWLEMNLEKIESFGDKVKDFLKVRLNRQPEELFQDNNFLFLTDCFKPSYENFGLNLYTDEEINLTNEKFYTSQEVSELLSVPKSTLRSWGYDNKVRTYTTSKGIKTMIWAEADIERFKHRRENLKGNKGYKFTPEQKAHLSEVRKGKKQSEETKRKRAESMKKVWANVSDEERKRRTDGLKEYNKKISETGLSDERKKKISESQKGRKQSEETKRKRRESFNKTIAERKKKQDTE